MLTSYDHEYDVMIIVVVGLQKWKVVTSEA